MKIKTKIQLNIILSLVLAGTTSLLLFLAIQAVNEASKKERIAAEGVKGVAELKIITHEYLLNPGARSLMQMQSKYDSLTKRITGDAFKGPDEKILLDRILRNLKRVKTVFTNLTTGLRKKQRLGKLESATSRALRERLIGELLVKSQAAVSHVFHLQQEIQANLVTTQKRAALLIVLVLLGLTAVIVGISLWVNKSIARPIAGLEEGTRIIGSGNLDHKVGITTTDEIGQLSRAFDQMTDDLKKTTASISELNREIAERKKAEEEQEKLRAQLSNAVEMAHLGHWEYDVANDLFMFNDHFYKIFRTTAQQVGGYTMSSAEYARRFVHPDDIPVVGEETRKAVEATDPNFSRQLEHRMLYADGTIGHITVRFFIVKDAHGQTVKTYGVNQDITERVHAEEALRESQKMQAIATLAGGIAHEFNNTLVGITGNIDLLQMHLPDEVNIDKYTERMKASTHRMAHLTAQLLAYARGGKYQPKNISLSSFVGETLPLIKQTIDSSIRIETDLSHDISNVEADLTQMQMVLSAILNNSAEAIEGEGRIRITTKNEEIDEQFVKINPDIKPGPYVSLTIQDDGKGMDEETRSRIFDPFFTTKFQGRGLGMAAVYGILINHGGWISVDSELGKGTVVRMYLPAVKVEVKEEEKPKIEPTKGTGTILLIEDEDIVIDVICAMVERLGYRVLLAKTGKEAVNIAKGFDADIDLAILDILLPDLAAKEVYTQIMEARPNLKVIVCSGYAIDGPPQEIMDAGAQDFIQKPFSYATLSEKLKGVLEGK